MTQMIIFISSLISGAIVGAIPGFIGYKKRKKGLAVAGFISCVIGSFLLGLFLSIPLCIIFILIILLKK